MEGRDVDFGLLENCFLYFWGKVGGDKAVTEGGTAVFCLQQMVQFLIQRRSQDKIVQGVEASIGAVNGEGGFLTLVRLQMPETFAL